jgi:hypothetical protein
LSKVFALLMAGITGLIIADFFSHPGTTGKLIDASTSESKLIAN